MPSTRRAFLGAAATTPAWSLPFEDPSLDHLWTKQTPALALPPRYGDRTLVVGVNGDRRRVVGVDPATGRTRWERLGRVEWTPETVGSRFVAAEDNAVASVKTATGETAWTNSLANDIVRTVELGPARETAYATTRTRVVAYDAATGDERWEVAENGRMYAATSDTAVLRNPDALVGYDAATGDERWRRATPENVLDAAPDGHVLVQNGGELTALDVATGETAWKYTAPNRLVRVLGVSHDHVVAREEGDDGTQHIVGIAAGEQAWQVRAAADTLADVTDDAVIFPVDNDTSGGKRRIAVVNPASGTVAWRGRIPSDTVFFSTGNDELRIPTDGGVVARALSDGTERWRYETQGRALYAVQRNGVVYVGAYPQENDAADFELHAIDPPYGTLARAEDWLQRYGVALGALAGLGLLGAASAGAGAYLKRRRVRGHVETIEQAAGWTTARVENGTVRTEYRPKTDATAEFEHACESWAARSDEDGVLELREWGTDPTPWVETAPYSETLADGIDRERGLRAVSTAADVLARGDHPHGALRPHAVALTDDGPAVRDLDVGRFLETGWQTRDDAFAPPEDATTPTGDVYRLGALAYYVLTGRAPTPPVSFDTRDLDTPLSDDLADVVTTATAVDPADRFDSPARFAEYLGWAAFAQEKNW